MLKNDPDHILTVEKWGGGSLFNIEKWPSGSFFNVVNFQRYIGILLIQNGIHTLLQWERNNVSVQFHIQVHLWCLVHKQRRLRKLSGPDVSCWILDQRHDREQYFCLLSRFFFLSIGMADQLHTSIYDKRDDFIPLLFCLFEAELSIMTSILLFRFSF